MPQKQPNSFLKYSGMVFQMGVIIGIAAWGGQKLDAHYHNKKAIFTIILSLFGIAAALYLTLRDFIKPRK
jgi:hypothetical protein